MTTRPGSPAPPPLTGEEYEALDAYRFAMLTHEHAGSYFPSTSELQKDMEPKSLIDARNYVTRLRERYTHELDGIIDDQVERYYEDALDRYHAFDPTIAPPIDNPEDWPRDYTDNKFKTIYHDSKFHNPTLLLSQFNTELTTTFMAHTEQERPYLERLKIFQERESARLKREKEQADQARIEAEKKFPRTVPDWENISNATRKLFLARFFTFTLAEKEENMKKQTPPWTWDDVDPLCNTYKADVNFRERIDKFIQSHMSTDPRRKPTGA
ncbi:unnamed protein product [Peniophora sp. CBMAI 1063]|nr:unnamed protein product [Peniophora sp. CBMAI 1063]